jgi:DNA-binding beta-propeller fold protein YncE
MVNRILRAAVVTAACAFLAFPSAREKKLPAPPDTQAVGQTAAGRTVVPVNQVVTPAGVQVPLPGLRPQAMALSPDDKFLAVAGKTSELIIIDPATGQVRQRVTLPAEGQGAPRPEATSLNILEPDDKGQLSYTGLVISPDGGRIYLSHVNGSVKVFTVGADGTVAPAHTIPLPPAGAPRRKEEIPAGLALTADGRRLYVCGNLSNRLLELDTASGEVLRTFDVGVAPYDVVLAGGKAYVSNWGGRRPEPGDLTGPAGQGTEVRGGAGALAG